MCHVREGMSPPPVCLGSVLARVGERGEEMGGREGTHGCSCVGQVGKGLSAQRPSSCSSTSRAECNMRWEQKRRANGPLRPP